MGKKKRMKMGILLVAKCLVVAAENRLLALARPRRRQIQAISKILQDRDYRMKHPARWLDLHWYLQGFEQTYEFDPL